MKTILLLIFIIIILLVIYVIENTYYVTINTVDISATFEGVLKIAHISDIHGN